ncbi:hypothetical protein, partial [Burkholderia sp. Se-20378]|uniref:hypothetical protein n=1 Tax=Burkholderia sp. Se-20378 TaxID=2703899 RepID=UPI001980F856
GRRRIKKKKKKKNSHRPGNVQKTSLTQQADTASSDNSRQATMPSPHVYPAELSTTVSISR